MENKKDKLESLLTNINSREQQETESNEIKESFRKNTISRFRKLLSFSIEAEVTDILLVANRPHYWRYGGKLHNACGSIWTVQEIEVVARHILSQDSSNQAYLAKDSSNQSEFDDQFLSAELTYQADIPDYFTYQLHDNSQEDSYDLEYDLQLNQENNQENNQAYNQENKHEYKQEYKQEQYRQPTQFIEEEKMPQRFRASIFKEQGNFRIVLRIIPTEMRTIAELNLPTELENIVKSKGLVLVTGATGQGKSTTISAMLEYINQNMLVHIITLEDPIEFVYRPKQSVITQREIGSDGRYIYDAKDYPKAIKEALRQSPDVITVGEIRDAQTFEAVLTAAESGHLVISAIHTSDVMATIEKIISYYPEREARTILNRLSRSLAAIISQKLLPSASDKIQAERLPAVEIMKVVPGVTDCLRDIKKINEIPSKMKSGYALYGMRTFDQHITKLVHEGLISADTALAYATSDEVAVELRKNRLIE